MGFRYKLAILIRKDLDLSPGKAVAQGAHAAVGCVMLLKGKDSKTYRKWDREGGKKVALAVSDERELLEMVSEAKKAGLVTYKVSDAGMTEVPPGTLTCVGIGPDTETKVDQITGALSLYR